MSRLNLRPTESKILRAVTSYQFFKTTDNPKRAKWRTTVLELNQNAVVLRAARVLGEKGVNLGIAPGVKSP